MSPHHRPLYTFDAMLKYTKVELKLLIDIDMLMFLEKGIREKLTKSPERYAKANYPNMENYDPQQNTKYLMYYDVDNVSFIFFTALIFYLFIFIIYSFTVGQCDNRFHTVVWNGFKVT